MVRRGPIRSTGPIPTADHPLASSDQRSSQRGRPMTLRLHNLHALRGAACLLVVVTHISCLELHKGAAVPHPVLYPVAFFGFAAVDLFFLISGFVLTWSHADGF